MNERIKKETFRKGGGMFDPSAPNNRYIKEHFLCPTREGVLLWQRCFFVLLCRQVTVKAICSVAELHPTAYP